MKTDYKYIHFEKTEQFIVGCMPIYECKNNKKGTVLGFIFFYPNWRQYCFTQKESDVVFSLDCLEDIIDFLKQLNKERNDNQT